MFVVLQLVYGCQGFTLESFLLVVQVEDELIHFRRCEVVDVSFRRGLLGHLIFIIAVELVRIHDAIVDVRVYWIILRNCFLDSKSDAMHLFLACQ